MQLEAGLKNVKTLCIKYNSNDSSYFHSNHKSSPKSKSTAGTRFGELLLNQSVVLNPLSLFLFVGCLVADGPLLGVPQSEFRLRKEDSKK